MKRLLPLCLAVLMLAACGTQPSVELPSTPTVGSTSTVEVETVPPEVPTTQPPTETPVDAVDELLGAMTLEQKVRQLFFITIGDRSSDQYATPTDEVLSLVAQTEAGGYVLFTKNITTVDGTRALTDAVKGAAAIVPFIGIDEEGGIVSRLAAAGLPGYTAQPKAADVGATGDTGNAYAVGDAIGAALCDIGVTVDFAPDADVLTEPGNTAIGSRSFGSDPQLVADMVSAFMEGLHSNGILAAPKHFPGHGGTIGDSHDGFVSIDYDREHLNTVEYLPFKRAIAEGCAFILVGHITAPNADNSGLPATLSSYFLTDVLRGELGFDGIIITDAMDMGAITENYGDEAMVMALHAGADMLLMPADYEAAVAAVLGAVESGKLSEARIELSVRRVLQAKLDAGILG